MRTLLFLTLSSAAFAADPGAGKTLFEKKCAICHATESSERRIGPSLKGVKDGSLPSHRDATHDAILQKIESGGGGMPVFRDLLKQDQKEDLVAYVLTL